MAMQGTCLVGGGVGWGPHLWPYMDAHYTELVPPHGVESSALPKPAQQPLSDTGPTPDHCPLAQPLPRSLSPSPAAPESPN